MDENKQFGNSEQLNDTISRAAVVDEIEGVDWYHINRNGEMVHGANDAEHQAWYKADDIYAAIERVPSAQPVAKDINVPVKDCISRQAALDALEQLVIPEDMCVFEILSHIELVIGTLPSAQWWIPCSERLPDAGEYYFVTVQHYGCDCTECRTIDIAKYELDGWRSCHNVLAWMPLPAPWKGEKE